MRMPKRAPTQSRQRVVVRRLRKRDLKQVQALQRECFPGVEPWRKEQFNTLIESFPEGQICVELDEEIVATSSSIRVNGAAYTGKHSFKDLETSATRNVHDPEGDSLYGIDIAVRPKSRGFRFARRLYEARKELVRELNLRRILIGGRVPNFHKYADDISINEYVRRVVQKQIRDPTINAQLANGFAVRQVLAQYLPSDHESRGYAVLMEWLNPDYVPPERQEPDSVRVATVNYQMRPVESFEDFARQCEFFLDTAADYRADFLLFPELLTNQLFALLPPDRPAKLARGLGKFTQQYLDFFSRAAIRYNVNVIGGTHLVVEDGTLYNIAYLFHRDGRIGKQYKIHITPSERRWWGVEPGNRVEVFDTDVGKVSILICYDSEFPELARVATARGARIFFVPYNTDIRAAHIRVRSCTAARCIENHVYAVLSGAIGNLPEVEGADIHYAQAAVLTPSDIAFPRDGIAAQATENVEALILHDLDLATLRRTRRLGSVRTWMDRRTDLYKVVIDDGDPGEF